MGKTKIHRGGAETRRKAMIGRKCILSQGRFKKAKAVLMEAKSNAVREKRWSIICA
jgi:hypothetical protein